MVYPDPDHNPNHDPNPNLQILISKFDLFLLQAWGRLSSLTAWWWILILILILILISKSNYSNLIFVPSLRKVEPLDCLMVNPDPPENPHFAPSRCVAIKLTRKLPKILQNPHFPLQPFPTIPHQKSGWHIYYWIIKLFNHISASSCPPSSIIFHGPIIRLNWMISLTTKDDPLNWFHYCPTSVCKNMH